MQLEDVLDLLGPEDVWLFKAVAEAAGLVVGIKPGRQSPDQITLYKSVGVAVQDAAATALVIAAARRQSVGQLIDL